MSSNFIWLVGLRCVLQSLKEGWGPWGSVIYFCSTERGSKSGCGVLFIRERPYERLLWILNMATRRVGGALMRFMGRSFGKIS
jgi:hypothetical protein